MPQDYLATQGSEVWVRREDKKGRAYYMNKRTHATQWERPEGCEIEEEEEKKVEEICSVEGRVQLRRLDKEWEGAVMKLVEVDGGRWDIVWMSDTSGLIESSELTRVDLGKVSSLHLSGYGGYLEIGSECCVKFWSDGEADRWMKSLHLREKDVSISSLPFSDIVGRWGSPDESTLQSKSEAMKTLMEGSRVLRKYSKSSDGMSLFKKSSSMSEIKNTPGSQRREILQVGEADSSIPFSLIHFSSKVVVFKPMVRLFTLSLDHLYFIFYITKIDEQHQHILNSE